MCHNEHIDYLFTYQIIALASMWCLHFTEIEEKLEVYNLNMSSDSHTDEARNPTIGLKKED